MPQSSHPEELVLSALVVQVRGLTEAGVLRATNLPAGEVRRALLRLEAAGTVRRRGGMWLAVSEVAQATSPTPTAGRSAPTGLDLIRRLCLFHADVVEEIQNSKFEFTDDAPQVDSQVLMPVDWGQLSRGEVRVSRTGLPESFAPGGAGRVIFCGPLHRVLRRRRGGEPEWLWLPVFLARATCVREQTEIRFQLDGEVDLNSAWAEEAFSQGDEDRLEDTLIRLGMLREDAPGRLSHIPVRHFGECWSALDQRFPEHSWVRHRNLLAPTERVDLRGDQREGFHPVVLLFHEDQSPFSKALVSDLRDIAKATDAEIESSALSALLPESAAGPSTPRPRPSAPTLVEFSPLNPIQSDAVRDACTAPLTVIQGPPGTGKSTVVRSTLLTLGVHGSTALFGSTNHKAVDAVVERMNERATAGRLVADLRGANGGTKKWTRHLLDHLDAGRTAEALDLEAFRTALAQADASICHVLTETRSVLDAGDRMVELQARLSALANEHGEWFADLGAMTLPFTSDDFCVQPSEIAALPSLKRLFAKFKLWRRLVAFRAAWPNHPRPPHQALHALLMGKLDQMRLADVEAELKSAPSLDERAEALVALVEGKAEQVEQALGRLPAAWANRVRDRGPAIAEVRREADGRGRSAVQRQGEVEAKRIRELLPGLPLWTVTNLSVGSTVPFVSAAFDLALIDEAGQCNPASVLPMLFRAKRALFVGDPQQLRPVGSLARHKEDFLRRKHGLDAAEFSRFAFSGRSAYDLGHDALIERGGHAFLLREHYRCHPAIAEFFNEHFYGGSLIVRTTGRDASAPRQGITWTHVEGGSLTLGSSRWHPPQVDAITAELKRLAVQGFDGSVGVVTPFREHAKRTRDKAFETVGPSQLERWDFICETADGFQGGERDLILFGLVGGGEGVSATPPFYLRERNRFNVAISRARHHLHVFGDQLWARGCGVPVLADLAAAALSRSERPEGAVRTDLIGPVWEPRLAEALRLEGLEFRQQYPAQGYHLDFAFFPGSGRKVNVEVDGESYHRDRNGNLRAEDVRRDLVLRADGWTVRRFWVYQLRDDWEFCLREIRGLVTNQ